MPEQTDVKILLDDLEYRDSPVKSFDPIKVFTSREIEAYTLIPRFKIFIDIHSPLGYDKNVLLNPQCSSWSGPTIPEVLDFPVIGNIHAEDIINYTSYIRGAYARAIITGIKSKPLVFLNLLSKSFPYPIYAEGIDLQMRVSIGVRFDYEFFTDVSWVNAFYNTMCATSYNTQIVYNAGTGHQLLTPETKNKNISAVMQHFGTQLALLQDQYRAYDEFYPHQALKQIFRNAAYII